MSHSEPKYHWNERNQSLILLGSTKPCLFWSMDIESKMCVLKQNNNLTPDGTGFISGNRACGLLGNRTTNISFFFAGKTHKT